MNREAALGYYRAMFAPDGGNIGAAVPRTPTRYLHGRDDGCIGVEIAQRAAAYLPEGSDTRIVDGAGRFLHLERPAEINQLVLDWLAR